MKSDPCACRKITYECKCTENVYSLSIIIIGEEAKERKKNSYNLCGTTTKKKGQGEIRF